MNYSTSDILNIIVASGVISVLVSGIVTWLINERKVLSSYDAAFMDKYRESCDEIMSVLSPLVSRTINPVTTQEQREKMAKEMLRLFYEHFFYLPGDVLRAMACLYRSLKSDGCCAYMFSAKGIYKCTFEYDIWRMKAISTLDKYFQKKKYDTLRYRINHSGEICSSRGMRRYLNIIREIFRLSEMRKYPKGFILNLQARYLMAAMNQHFGPNHIRSWHKTIIKDTIASK